MITKIKSKIKSIGFIKGLLCKIVHRWIKFVWVYSHSLTLAPTKILIADSGQCTPVVHWLQSLHSIWDNSIPKDQASVTLLQGNCANETRDFMWEVGGRGGLVTKSCLTLALLWTVAGQAPLSMGFSRQEYWSGLPFPSLGIPGIEPAFPAWQEDSLPLSHLGSPPL